MISRESCLAQDAADPLAFLRAQFHLPEGIIYLDGNSLGALPRSAVTRVAETVQHEWGDGLVRSWNDAHWMTLPERIGAKIARLIGARAKEVVATDSTSVNLFKVLAAALRIQAERHPERSVILSERGNFPTDLYVAQGLIDLLASRSQTGSESIPSLVLVEGREELETALAERPALVLLTHVNYRSGAVHDMAEVTAKAHAQGSLVVWDLAHSAGALPLAVNEAEADFAVGCGYKYLNGGPGAPAFVFVAERHQERFWQPLSGWIGHAAPFEFDPQYRPAGGVGRYLCGTPPIVSMVALEAGLDSVLAAEASGGMTALRAKSLQLGELFIGLVESRCSGRGLALASPRDPVERGSQVSFAAGSELGAGYALMRALIARGVIGDFRAPNLLRFGFTPLYTRFADVWDAVQILAELLETRAWDRIEYHEKASVT
jgi:kynureninase